MPLPLPTLCAICHGWAASRVCASCWQRHATPRLRCPRCALPAPAAGTPCADCVRSPPPFVHSVAAVDYGFPWNQLLAGLKYREGLDRAPALAAALVAAVVAADAARPSLVVPVPLGPSRLRERGFNQAWELARRVGRGLGIAASAGMLVRWLDVSTPQSALRRDARFVALRGVFGVAPDAAATLQGRSVALVDDVMTTGATAAEASRVLLAAGAASVHVWVFARTPAP